MLTICKNNANKVKSMINKYKLDAIAMSSNNLVDDIILAMVDEGIIDCLDKGIIDKRRHNSFVPFRLIMALAIAAKMKVCTSLTDIPYAIQDHRTLAELGYNLISNDKGELFTEGTIRYLIGKYSAEDLIKYYNNTFQNFIAKAKGIEPDIHILDCTKIAVNMDNDNYELSSIAVDRKGNKMRGYKLASLRGIYRDTGVIEEIEFGTAATHDIHLCENLLKTTNCFKEGDILINDRGFLSRDLINFLKTERKVDTYVPLRVAMIAYEDAVLMAKVNDTWHKHPNKKRTTEVIAFVPDVGNSWVSAKPTNDVPLNACVVWNKEIDNYMVFVTTDLNATASDIIKVYEMRPEIEEDFRQLKDFWELEDFKSTKYHLIVFHIICVLFGYLFYQLFINSKHGQKYLGRSLPVVLKNYKTKIFNYLVLYSGNYFCCMNIKEFFEFRDSCSKEVQKYLLEFFE